MGMKLYEQLDQICRRVAHDAVKKLGISPSKVDVLLDPVHQIGKPVERDHEFPDVCYSSYVPDGFVSSFNPLPLFFFSFYFSSLLFYLFICFCFFL